MNPRNQRIAALATSALLEQSHDDLSISRVRSCKRIEHRLTQPPSRYADNNNQARGRTCGRALMESLGISDISEVMPSQEVPELRPAAA